MDENKKEVLYIPVDDILPNRFQPRLAFDEKELNELANSIIKYGVIQPIVVRPMGTKFEIIAGERRYKASTIAGLKRIPAILMGADDNTSAEIALLENLQRKNLTPIEEAKSYKKLIERGFTQEDIAIKLGVSQPLVANKIRLLNLPDEVQDALLYNQISERHARSLLVLNNEDLQKSLLRRIIKEKLTVKQTEDEVKLLNDRVVNEIPGEIKGFLRDESAPIVKRDEVPNDEIIEPTEKFDFVDLAQKDIIDIKDDEEDDEIQASPIENIQQPANELPINEDKPLINPFVKQEEAVVNPLEEEAKNDTIENNGQTSELKVPFNPFNETSEMINEKNSEAEERQKSIREQLGLDDSNSPNEPAQKSIREQLADFKYEPKEPTIEDLNTSEEYNRIERIDTSLEAIDAKREMESQDQEFLNSYGEIDLPKVINKVREFINDLGNISQLIEISEIDLPSSYQITVNIKKEN